MSQSRFSIVLVGVSALLRQPLVSRLRPADGERSSWVVFAARGGRFDSGFRWAGWPSGSLLPLFGTHRFGDSARWLALPPSVSEWPLGEFVLPPSASGLPLGEFVLPSSVSEIAIRRVGLRAHRFRFRHAPLRSGRWASWFFRLPLRSGPRRVGLRAHCFRFSACTDSGWPLGEFVLSPSASEIALGGLAFGLTASAFRHAPLRRLPSASSFFRLPLRRLPSASWPSGSPLPLFGMRRSAPPRR